MADCENCSVVVMELHCWGKKCSVVVMEFHCREKNCSVVVMELHCWGKNCSLVVVVLHCCKKNCIVVVMELRFILSKILQWCYTHAKNHIAHLCYFGTFSTVLKPFIYCSVTFSLLRKYIKNANNASRMAGNI